ncbi:MAG: T9SS type A sorting domain-containing protein [Bacteroidales bacterium]|nr:T9SS type A sorting domain-containing protein [Bacteroidales bacterium]
MKTIILQILMIAFSPILVFGQWVNNPTLNSPICVTQDWSVLPRIVTDEDGNSYISWFSGDENLNFNVYMQRLDAYGNNLWENNGLLISDNQTDTWVCDYDLVLDNENAAVLVTQDRRTGASNAFAYRMSSTGEFLWGDNGIQLTNTPEADYTPKAIVTDNNDFIFMWNIVPEDTTNTPVKVGMQKVSAAGSFLWGDGVVVSDTMHYYACKGELTSENDLMASWLVCPVVDTIHPGTEIYFHVLAQKFDMDGNAQWENPIQVDTGKLLLYLAIYTNPKMICDDNGGAFILWESFFGDNATLLLQHIDKDGNLLWPGPLNISTLMEDIHGVSQICKMEENQEIYVFWQEFRLEGSTDCFGIYGQKISYAGERLWGDEAKAIIPLNCAMDTTIFPTKVKKTTANDVIVFFEKEYLEVVGPDTLIDTELYATRIGSDGQFLWDEEIINVSTADGEKSYYMGVSDCVNDQLIAVWSDDRNSFNEMETDIYAQNIHVDGSIGPQGIFEVNESSKNVINNFPNPFSNNTTISISIIENCDIKLSLYDYNGKFIKEIFNKYLLIGNHKIPFNESDLNQGVYILKCESKENFVFHKMVII